MSEWQPDGTGVQPAGDIGGDAQAGEAWSVRFVRPDMPGSLITVSFYAAVDEADAGMFRVQRQVEYLTCTDPADPGGTETWSDYTYQDQPGAYGSARRADDNARYAAIDLAHTNRRPRYLEWDGQPVYNHAELPG